MNLTTKRYRRLWIILGSLTFGFIALGDTHVVSYTLGSTVESVVDSWSSFSNTENEVLPDRRRGHPREELFMRPVLPQE